jgi:hypothetical protein
VEVGCDVDVGGGEVGVFCLHKSIRSQLLESGVPALQFPWKSGSVHGNTPVQHFIIVVLTASALAEFTKIIELKNNATTKIIIFVFILPC